MKKSLRDFSIELVPGPAGRRGTPTRQSRIGVWDWLCPPRWRASERYRSGGASGAGWSMTGVSVPSAGSGMVNPASAAASGYWA